MLQAIRDRVTGIVAIIILGLLAIPFVFFGIDGYFRAVPQDAVAIVGDSEITVTEFQSEFSRYRAQLRAQMGDVYDELAANRPEARREFLERLIDRQLLENLAEDLKLDVAPSTVAEIIQSIPAFQVDGRFDPGYYRQRLQAIGQSPREFETGIIRDLMVQSVPAAVSSSTPVTDAEVDRWLTLFLETRSVRLLRVAGSPLVDRDAVTEEEIQAWYEQNREQYMLPERVTVEYLLLDANRMVESLEIDEKTLKDRYEAVRDRFMTPERRHASHILITTEQRSEEEAEALIRALASRIASGESFAELAREYSEDPVSAVKGGDLGWIEPGVMMPAFEEALFAMQPGTVSEPVKTEFGWHLIRLEEIEAPRGQSFEEARAQIAEEVRQERAEELFVEMTDRLVDMIYADPTGLEAIGADLDLPVTTVGPFSRENPPELLADSRVLETIFSDLVLIERQSSEPIEIGPNRAVVVRVVDQIPPAPRALDDVREEIRDRIALDKAREQARARAEAMLAEVRAGASLDSVAEAQALTVESREVTRRSFDLPADVIEGIFRMPLPGEGEASHAVLDAGMDWLVVALEQVSPGDPAAAQEIQRESARQQIRLVRSAQEYQGLMQWLRDHVEIRVIEERLQ
ncbi:MAG: peptidyl-prolyl cis-trans isomerase [Wenzhouxiangellaceae bacterium]